MTVDKAVSGQLGPDSSNLCSSIEYAVALATKAVLEDYKGNDEKALSLYEESIPYFVHTIEHDAKLEHTKDKIRQKMKQYQDRVLILKEHLDERRTGKK